MDLLGWKNVKMICLWLFYVMFEILLIVDIVEIKKVYKSFCFYYYLDKIWVFKLEWFESFKRYVNVGELVVCGKRKYWIIC